MPPKAPDRVFIAPGTVEQTQGRGSGWRSEISEPSRSSEGPTRIRTRHACDRCRELRAKCSGGRRCAKCTKDDADCQYSDRKREQYRKQLGHSAQQLQDAREEKQKLLGALRRLVEDPEFPSERHLEVFDLLEEISEDLRSESTKFAYGSESQSQSQSQSFSQSNILSESRSQIQNRIQREQNQVFGVQQSEDPLERLSGLSSGGESLAMSDVGSPGRQRELLQVVDLGSGHGIVGYVGKMSGTSWMQRANEYLVGIASSDRPDIATPHIDTHVMKATTLTYFMDDQDLLEIDEDYIDPHELPSWHSALILSEAYFHSLQGAFRFVQRENFLKELKRTYESAARGRLPSWSRRRYLSVANMMWSIGAKWLETRQPKQPRASHVDQTPIESHLVYYARARSLGLDHRIQLDHPDIQTVQGLGILAFYLMANGSIQRAWGLVGQAIRHAIALGLHLKVAAEAISHTDHRSRARVWYSLFRLEILLSEMTGRPKCLRVTDATVHFDLSFQQQEDDDPERPITIDQSVEGIDSRALWRAFLGSDLEIARNLDGGVTPWDRFGPVGSNMTEKQFAAGLELSVISDKIGTMLYLSPADLTWAEVQDTIQSLQSELANWHENLYPELKLDNVGVTDIDPRSHLELELYYCSVSMILCRPSLCEIRIHGESQGSTEFNRLSARACVQAAIRMVSLMPDEPVAEYVFQVLPWWSLLHYVCQAAAVLLLELCLNVQHMPSETREVMFATKKAMNYLWSLAPSSKSAFKAWTIVRLLVQKVTLRYQRNVLMDIPADAPKPRNWTEDDEHGLMQTVANIVQ